MGESRIEDAPFARRSTENDGAVRVDERAPVEMEPDSAAENTLLERPAFPDEILDRVTVRNRGHPLGDDRPLVEVLGHIMTRRPDKFDTATVGGMVGAGAGESREEGVMDIDDPARKRLRQSRAENLHVAGEDDEVNMMCPQHRDLRLLLRGFCGLCDREMMKGDPESLGDALQVFAIAHNERNLHAELPALVAGEKIVKAVIVVRDEEGDSRDHIGKMEFPGH